MLLAMVRLRNRCGNESAKSMPTNAPPAVATTCTRSSFNLRREPSSYGRSIKTRFQPACPLGDRPLSVRSFNRLRSVDTQMGRRCELGIPRSLIVTLFQLRGVLRCGRAAVSTRQQNIDRDEAPKVSICHGEITIVEGALFQPA